METVMMIICGLVYSSIIGYIVNDAVEMYRQACRYEKRGKRNGK